VTDWPILLLLATLLIALAVYGYRGRPGSAINRWFALQTLALALWVIGIAGTHSAYYPEFWGRWTFAAACLIPPTFFGFTCRFPEGSGPRATNLLRVIVGTGVLLALLSAFSPLIAHNFVLTPSGLRRQAGPLMIVFSFYLVVGSVLVIALLSVKWRRATGQARAQLRFYNVGLSILSVGGLTTNLVLPALTGHSGYSTVGPFFSLPLVVLIGHAIIRHRLFDLRLLIHRGAAFVILIVVVSATIVVVLEYLQVEDTLSSLKVPFEAVVLAVVAAVSLSLPVAPRLARLMDSYLLRGRPDLDRALQEAARRLSRVFTKADITAEIEAIVKSSLAVDRVTVLTDTLERRALPATICDAAWSVPSSAPSLLVLAQEGESSDFSPQVRTLRGFGFEVWVAMKRGSQRTGLILLGPRNGGDAYLASNLQFLEDLAELSSMAFEVAFLHRRQIELERDSHRLEHFARMGRAYAGLGHEIRTPLTTISNLVSLIPDRLDDAEFRDVLTRLIPGEVARIVRLTEKLRLLAPGEHARLGPVSLPRILSDLAAMFGASTDRISVQLRTPSQVPDIHGDESQLVQLFTNLINNAVEAMPQGGTIVLRVVNSRGEDGQALLAAQVLDEGPGIAPDVSDRLFEPFFTTKPSGTGLGLSICREIADFHRATIHIRSRDGARGGIATVEFPLEFEHGRNAAESVSTNLRTSSFSDGNAAPS
jgi:signal transduction histidine kinase